MVYHDRVYIFYTVGVQLKRPFGKAVYFCQMFDVFFGFYSPFLPLDPRRPLHMLYMFIATCHCPKGILGLGGGGASKNKLKDTSFTFPVTNVTILSIFRTHAQEGYCKVLEINSNSILYSLTLLLYEN